MVLPDRRPKLLAVGLIVIENARSQTFELDSISVTPSTESDSGTALCSREQSGSHRNGYKSHLLSSP